MEHNLAEIRTGDVVAVTARVTGLRGDGSYSIEPLGFDFDIDWQNEEGPDFYTIEDPKFLQHHWMRGDEMYACDGEKYLYHENMGEGVHLLNRPGCKQDLTAAWATMTTEQVQSLKSEPPPD